MLKKISCIFICMLLVCASVLSAFAHSGRTDGSGGHRDNKNKSGLGRYHYHCGGYPAHLHTNGVCPYRGGNSKSSSSYSSTPKKVYATKVEVSNMPASIFIGESISLKGSVYPNNAEDKSISWKSSNTSVATIDVNGKLSAVGVGTTVISATTSRGTTARYTLTVNEIEAKSITVDNKINEIIIGESKTFSATITPENTTNKDIEWKSADSSIASIDASGKLTAVAVGKTTISAVHRKLSDTFEIEVKPIEAESIEIELRDQSGEIIDEYQCEVGKEMFFSAVVLPENTTDPSVTWAVDNSEMAEINEDNVLVGLKPGKVRLTATATNGITDSIEIEIYKTLQVGNFIYSILAGGAAIALIALPIVIIVWLIKRKK